jgi:hypothetical protein
MGCLEVLLESVMSVSVEGKSKHGGKSRAGARTDAIAGRPFKRMGPKRVGD